MVLVGKVFVGHVSGVAAVGNLADGIDKVVGNAGSIRLAAEFLVSNNPLASDDELMGCPGNIVVSHVCAADAGVAVDVRFVNMDRRHIGIKCRESQQLEASVWAD